MGQLFKRGGTWYGDWRDEHGIRHRKSLATRDREVARQRLRARELAAPAHRAADGKALHAALTHLLDTVYAGRNAGTVACYTTKARHLERLLGEQTPVTSITREAVLQYRASRIAERAAETTIAKELVVLRLVLREQGIDGVVPRVKVRYVPRRRYLSYDNALALLEELPQRRRLWLMVAVYAGPRAGELERLTWDHVDLVRGWMRLPGTKTDEADQEVPIAPALQPWLEAWADGADPGPVLEPWANYRRDLARACERVGMRVGTARIGVRVPAVSANDLRRTFASWLVQDGVSNRIVAWLLRHKTTRMVDLVYGQSSPEALTSAVARLPGVPWDAGGTADRAPVGRIRASETVGTEASSGNLVPRVGIEPTTRGFSGRRSLRIVR
jgi:integrase